MFPNAVNEVARSAVASGFAIAEPVTVTTRSLGIMGYLYVGMGAAMVAHAFKVIFRHGGTIAEAARGYMEPVVVPVVEPPASSTALVPFGRPGGPPGPIIDVDYTVTRSERAEARARGEKWRG